MRVRTCVFLALLVAVAAAMPSPLLGQTPAPGLAKELVASFQRASTEMLDIAEVMPAEKYGYKPVADISTFGDQLVHVAGIVQRFVDVSKNATAASAPHHGPMAKPE